jgi:hypothetical protein
MAGAGSRGGRSAPTSARHLRRAGISRAAALGAALVLVPVGGCAANTTAASADGCLVDPNQDCALDLLSYACSGSARPDQNPTFSQGVQGIVCTDEGSLSPGQQGYCCTPTTTTCAYNPSAVCPSPTYGYSCLGTNRPDAFDPTLSCGQGIASAGLIAYCCGAETTAACAKDTNLGCADGTTGFRCTGPGLPTEGELGVDESRSDAPLLCNVPTAAANGVSDYCCYTPTDEPTGATCLQDQSVPGCVGPSYGFACGASDTPDQDYPRMVCSQAGVRGVDQQGVAALLYCCDFQQ